MHKFNTALFVRFLFFRFLLVVFAASPVAAQTGRAAAPLVFLDCAACDFAYIRREVPFVNWVRDREDAVVHILVTDQGTAAGGREYVLDFLGRKQHADRDGSLRYVAQQGASDDVERQGLAQILKIGLLPYLADSPILSRLQVSYEAGAGAVAPAATAAVDPWDSWVFRIDGSGWLQRESQLTEISLDGGLTADRITEDWRIRNYLDLDYDEDRFQSNGLDTQSRSHHWAQRSNVVRSVGPHWSVGISGEVWSDTYDNTRLGLRLAPAMEFSYWPYVLDRKKRLTVAYYVGSRSLDYRKRTIFGHKSETRFEERLQIDLELTQPWGSVRGSVEGSHYFHDVSRYRVES
ncbi:MAG: hypothetical protein O2782_07095 [bacterium]|nr:hypothetical protein [bacterium]